MSSASRDFGAELARDQFSHRFAGPQAKRRLELVGTSVADSPANETAACLA